MIMLEYGEELEIENDTNGIMLNLTIWDEQLREEFTGTEFLYYKELSENNSRYLIENTIEKLASEIQIKVEELWEEKRNND